MGLELIKDNVAIWGAHPMAFLAALLIGVAFATYVCRNRYMGQIDGLKERINLKDDFIKELTAKPSAAEPPPRTVNKERPAKPIEALQGEPILQARRPRDAVSNRDTEAERHEVPSFSIAPQAPQRFDTINQRITDGLDYQLRNAILGHRFQLVFNPVSGRKKVVTFLPNGQIEEGRNDNEASWRVKGGRLEILQADGRVHSRFILRSDGSALHHTNEADTLSIKGQYLVPE